MEYAEGQIAMRRFLRLAHRILMDGEQGRTQKTTKHQCPSVDTSARTMLEFLNTDGKATEKYEECQLNICFFIMDE
jgi:hypothetical protein